MAAKRTTIESELRTLKSERELLTAEYVVEWAQSHPKSALYKAPVFCGWNVKKAAYQHYLWGARALIAMHVVYADGNRQLVSLSLDRSRSGGGYRDVDEVLRDRSLAEIMLEDALHELERVQKRYDQVTQLCAVWKEVKKARRKHGKPKTTERRPAA
jgi:hypothetical protein